MGLIIDTNIFINAENNRTKLELIAEYGDYGDAYISVVTMSELLVGVHLALNTDIRIKRSSFVESILSVMPVLHLNEAVARVYAEIWAHFMKPRKKMGSSVHDLQIAATALAHGFAVLTTNKADFKKIPGLDVVGF